MPNAFTLKNVVKRFPQFQLGPLNLELEPGTVLGYVGPNGAGKTTTIQCLTGLLRVDDGEISIFGRANNPHKPSWKYDIGCVGDIHVFYERWTAEKNLRFFSRFYPNWSEKKSAELAGRFRLPLDKKVKDFSTGDRVKLSLTRALAYSPKLLLLDEPTSGLDPMARSELLDELFEFLQKGESAIFYSTHILSDIKRLVDQLVFLDDGQVFLRSGKEDLTEKWRKISFTLPGENVTFEAAANHCREGNHHQIISFDFNTTVSQLQHLGAENIRENRITIDEIAVYIMKGGKNAATS